MRVTIRKVGWRLAVSALMVAMLVGAAPAGASPVAEPPVAKAKDNRKVLSKKSFERAELLYRQAKFRLAVAAYYKAMSYFRHPAYLFNIAQCHRNLGQFTKARFFYKLFLSETTDASNRVEVERFVAAMERKIAEKKRDQELKARRAAAAARSVTPPRVRNLPGKPYHQRWWFWTGLSVGLAALGAATYTGTQALLIQKKWDDNQGAPADDPNLKRRGEAFRTVTDVLIGVAVVSAGAAIIGAIVVAQNNRRDRARATVVPSCGPTGCGVWVTGRF